MLAAIPSIIYGMWGLFVFVPLFQEHIQPVLIDNLGSLPGLEIIFFWRTFWCWFIYGRISACHNDHSFISFRNVGMSLIV